MSAVDFEVLKLIPKMLEEMQCLKQEVTEVNYPTAKDDWASCFIVP